MAILTTFGAKMPNQDSLFIDIGLLVYPGVLMSSVYGLSDLFLVANAQARTLGHSGKTIRTSLWSAQTDGVVRANLQGSNESLQNIHVIIAPPTLGEPPVGDRLGYIPGWLRGLHSTGTMLASVCGGVYVLAETGLLSGRTITTHWEHGESVRTRYPDVAVDVEKLIIDEGDIITAGGMMSWIDLGLNLVDRFMGSKVMLATARFMVVDPGAREQRFYSGFRPRLDHGDSAILELQHWLHGTDTKRLTLTAMANRLNLTPRTFLRRFNKATGLNPTEYCQRLKMAKSRELLGRAEFTLEEVARVSGYEDPKAYRQIFRKVFGLSPAEYRVRFVGSNIDRP